MDEVIHLTPGGSDDVRDPRIGGRASLDPETLKSCLDFLFQAAVEQNMPLVANLIGAASVAVEENLRGTRN